MKCGTRKEVTHNINILEMKRTYLILLIVIFSTLGSLIDILTSLCPLKRV